MTWIKFVRFHKVRDEEAREYQEGDIVEMSPTSAHHFVRRGSAVEIPAPETLPAENVPEPEAASAPNAERSARKRPNKRG